MRDRFEIVYVDGRGAAQVVSRAVPNGYSARWKAVKGVASRLLPHPVRETGENPQGMCFVVSSVAYPEAGIVGVRERQ